VDFVGVGKMGRAAAAWSFLYVLVLFLGMVLVRAEKGSQVYDAAEAIKSEDGGENEAAALKVQIRVLEEGIKQKEMVLDQRENTISDLESEVRQHQHTQKEGSDSEVEVELEAALSTIKELETLVGRLRDESEKLEQEAKGLINRAESAQNKAATDLSEKERALKAVAEQESRLRTVEKGLEIAEAAMLKAQAEGETKAKELAATHKAWLPHWAATHTAALQRSVSSGWSTHGDPVVESLKRTASGRVADAHSFLKPHLETLNTKVNPVIRERWQQITLAVAPYLERVVKSGASSKEYLAPQVEKVHSTVQPYIQMVKEKSAPYVDQASNLLAPHLERVNTIAGPHYQRVLTTANSYHEQLQETVKENLQKHEALASLATKETVWFLAAALLGLPIVAVVTVIRSLFSGKKLTHHKRHRSHGGNTGIGSSHKRARRSKQVDKLGDKPVDKLEDKLAEK
jgi:hypothetical protein